jgi:CheY-like chemotaxis protein
MHDGLRLLLVEDDEMAALGMTLLLDDLGVDVRVASLGGQAIGLVADFQPDVVIVDLTLPDIDGVVLARHIRDAWPSLPIVLTSGYSEDHPGVREALIDPKTAFLPKPFEVQSLVDMARRLKSDDHSPSGSPR